MVGRQQPRALSAPRPGSFDPRARAMNLSVETPVEMSRRRRPVVPVVTLLTVGAALAGGHGEAALTAEPAAKAEPAAGPGLPNNQGKNSVSVTEQPFGKRPRSWKETLLTCTNASGNQVKLTTYVPGSWRCWSPTGRQAGKRHAWIRQARASYLTHKCYLGTHHRPIRQPHCQGAVRA